MGSTPDHAQGTIDGDEAVVIARRMIFLRREKWRAGPSQVQS